MSSEFREQARKSIKDAEKGNPHWKVRVDGEFVFIENMSPSKVMDSIRIPARIDILDDGDMITSSQVEEFLNQCKIYAILTLVDPHRPQS